MANLDVIVKQLEAERDRLEAAITALRGLSSSNSVGRTTARSRRTLSPAARRRIAAAQRARWAKVKAGKKVVPIKAGKRRISASGRARIAAATRARWAKFRAAKKG